MKSFYQMLTRNLKEDYKSFCKYFRSKQKRYVMLFLITALIVSTDSTYFFWYVLLQLLSLCNALIQINKINKRIKERVGL